MSPLRTGRALRTGCPLRTGRALRSSCALRAGRSLRADRTLHSVERQRLDPRDWCRKRLSPNCLKDARFRD